MQETIKKYLDMINKDYLTIDMINKTIEGTKLNLLATVNDLVGSEFEVNKIQQAYDDLKTNNPEIVSQIESEGLYTPHKEDSTAEYENIKSQMISMTEQISDKKVKLSRAEEFLKYYYDFIDGYTTYKEENFK